MYQLVNVGKNKYRCVDVQCPNCGEITQFVIGIDDLLKFLCSGDIQGKSLCLGCSKEYDCTVDLLFHTHIPERETQNG